MAYYSKEIPEWSNKDLSSFFDTNNNRQIAEIIQSHSLIGFDLFYLNLNDLKTELGITGYHDRLMAYREIRKLTLEHLKLSVMFEGECCTISLDCDFTFQLTQLMPYIASYFNIEVNDILIKDARNLEILSPHIKLIELMLISPEKYKTINISKMKDKQKPIERNQATIAYNNSSGNMLNNNKNNKPLVFKSANQEYKGKYTIDNTFTSGSVSGLNSNFHLNNFNTSEKDKSDDRTSIPQILYSRNCNNGVPNNYVKDNNSSSKLMKTNADVNTNAPVTINNQHQVPTESQLRSRLQTPNRKYNNDLALGNRITSYASNSCNKNKSKSNNYVQDQEQPDTSSSRNVNGNYYSNIIRGESALNRHNTTDSKGYSMQKDSIANPLTYNANTIDTKYKTEKRIYRQPQPQSHYQLPQQKEQLQSDLLKNSHYFVSENSIENDEVQFANNLKRNEDDLKHNTINCYQYHHVLVNDNNTGTNDIPNYSSRLPKQKHYSNQSQVLLKQHRTYHEDFND